jgi:hypothetical protein
VALLPYVVALIAVTPVALLCVGRVLQQAGEPALPLDDAFIHLQYAQRLADGHWFSYAPGDGYSSGATSLLWPVALSPFLAAGVDGLQAIWVVWALGALAHAGVAVETFRLAAGLAGRLAGWFAAGMCVVFGAFAWFAYSGMETVAFSWLLCRCARVAADLCESPAPTRGRRNEVLLLGLLAPLLRPEGAVGSLIATLALWQCWRRSPRRWARKSQLALAALPLAGPLVVPAMHWVLSGSPTSSTAQVKWLALDPYVDTAGFAAATWAQAHFLWTNLLQGGPWTVIFLPQGFGFMVLGGVLAVVLLGTRMGRRSLGTRGACVVQRSRNLVWRASFVVVIVLATMIPCTYGTMLWNRVRYIWPFAPAWFVGIACLGCVLGCWAARLRPALGAVTPAVLGALVASLALKLPWATFDLAQSARAVALQQVELGRWAAVLPTDARIGVNDTGAIAYLSKRPVFDVVGLTTPGEARYWVAGAGSRFEHYERLDEERLPSHFIVYPHWMACPPVLGVELHRRTVLSQSILGGPTMVAYEARYDLLDSGARPFSQGRWGELLDELDVADLESEQAHGYVLGVTTAADNVAVMWPTRDGRVVADGGRFRRRTDEFLLSLPAGMEATLVMRVVAPGALEVHVDGRSMGEAQAVDASPDHTAGADGSIWTEVAIDLPPLAASPGPRRQLMVRPTAHDPYGSFHFWLFRR